jgi:hypothetical protein
MGRRKAETLKGWQSRRGDTTKDTNHTKRVRESPITDEGDGNAGLNDGTPVASAGIAQKAVLFAFPISALPYKFLSMTPQKSLWIWTLALCHYHSARP